MQEEGLTNEGRHHLLLLRKQAHDKGGIAESQHTYITIARLTACEVGVFYHNSRRYAHLFEEPLKFIAHGHITVHVHSTGLLTSVHIHL